jgi:glutathione S-transferase
LSKLSIVSNSLVSNQRICTIKPMQLFYSTSSPYARKVVVAAREAGVIDQIEILTASASPIERNQALFAANPLGKIPALKLDDGVVIYDSRVICEYVDGLNREAGLLPTDAQQRLATQTLHALGDGILDACLLLRYETFMRPAEFRWEEWIAGQKDKVGTSLDYLESQSAQMLNELHAGRITLGHIAIGCSLAYIEFREILQDWKTGHDNLAKWYREFSKRESMIATEPG